MIHLTRINRVPLVLNSDLIELVESKPDTVITLTTGQKILVLEQPDEIVSRVVEFRRAVTTHPFPVVGKRSGEPAEPLRSTPRVRPIQPEAAHRPGSLRSSGTEDE